MTDKDNKREFDGVSKIAWYVIPIGVLLLLLFLISPFFLRDNPLAQLFFNLVLAIVTTLISVYVTHLYSQRTLKDEFTRYGLQAWRSLDSLEVKLLQHLKDEHISENTLQSWILDVDAAKWAWRDLLREVFEVQDRLQAETEEVVLRYKREIASTSSFEERLKLEQKQTAELTALISSAPLSIKLPEEVSCPNCSSTLTARVGSSPGDSGWPICPNCKTRFPVFRRDGGSIELSDREPKKIIKTCPSCHTDITFYMYEEQEVSFLTKCPDCSTHIQFRGDLNQQELIDLGVTNANFICPYCENKNECWIAPGRRVSFKRECKTCNREVRITGKVDKFEVTTP